MGNRITLFFRLLVVLSMFFFSFTEYLDSCTSILVSKGASKNGAPMISYSCDGEFHPIPRIVPAADHKPGTMLSIGSWNGVKGKIPQVPHTYKLVGLMNEFQLAIGETTFDGRKELINKDGMFHYYPLMLIALKRAKTAREAIKVMADLVEKYGYCSSGESISIADKEEAWLLEIVGTGPGGKGAIWVAIRIPDGYVSATANMSRIREFPLDDPDKAMYSKNVISYAIEKGYYDPKSKKPFSFSAAYNPPTEEQVRYSARRVWSIFRRIAPSMNLSSDYSSYKKKAKPYSLYIKPDKKLIVSDVIALHRDHYEGTEFDMTKDITAGPFGAPDRWRPMKWKVKGKKYVWERPIATQQAGFVFVSESRSYVSDKIGGVYWYGLDNPYTNFFIPLYTSINKLPKSFTTGKLSKYTRDSAWWAFNFVANYANLRWSYMIKDIQNVQKEIEDMQFTLQPEVEKMANNLLKEKPEIVSEFLTKYCIDNAEANFRKWLDLGDFLITKYNDGYIQNEKHRAKEVGYPEKWLKNEVKKNKKRMRIKEVRGDDREL